MRDIRKAIAEINPEAMLLSEKYFDEEIVGIADCQHYNHVVIYDIDKILNILQRENDMSQEGALEYFEYNISGSYVGENSPIFMVAETFLE